MNLLWREGKFIRKCFRLIGQHRFSGLCHNLEYSRSFVLVGNRVREKGKQRKRAERPFFQMSVDESEYEQTFFLFSLLYTDGAERCYSRPLTVGQLFVHLLLPSFLALSVFFLPQHHFNYGWQKDVDTHKIVCNSRREGRRVRVAKN